MNWKKITLIITVPAFFIFVIVTFIEEANEQKGNSITFRRQPPKSFLNVFSKEAQSDLVYESGAAIKLRGDRAFFKFRKSYSFDMISFPASDTFNLQSDIIQRKGITDGDEPHVQGYTYADGYKITYNTGSVANVHKMLISFDGQVASPLLQNDSTACFSLKLKQAYVQTHPNGLYEVTVEHENPSLFEKNTSLTFLIKKKGRTLFLVTVSASDPNKTLDSKTLFGLINR